MQYALCTVQAGPARFQCNSSTKNSKNSLHVRILYLKFNWYLMLRRWVTYLFIHSFIYLLLYFLTYKSSRAFRTLGSSFIGLKYSIEYSSTRCSPISVQQYNLHLESESALFCDLFCRLSLTQCLEWDNVP